MELNEARKIFAHYFNQEKPLTETEKKKLENLAVEIHPAIAPHILTALEENSGGIQETQDFILQLLNNLIATAKA
jgi:hypothetical protein